MIVGSVASCLTKLSICVLLSIPATVSAKQKTNEPAAEPLWPDMPDTVKTEVMSNRKSGWNEFGLNRSVSKVTFPQIIVYEAAGKKRTGVGIVVCPGGGFKRIVIDREGHDIARWLNTQGIVVMVLKYRTVERDDSASLQDINRAVRVLRSRSRNLGVDPARIGVMGFSAGGYLVLRAAVHCRLGDSASNDSLAGISARPDFVAAIYPAVPPSFDSLYNSGSPPIFSVQAFDDRLPAEDNARILAVGKKAKVPVEMHIFARGGHGFGLGNSKGAVKQWQSLFIEWLKTMNFVETAKAAAKLQNNEGK